MATSIPQTLQGVGVLNRPGQPFAYQVSGNSIIGFWLWQDQTLIAPTAVTDVIRTFRFIVTLNENGTYSEQTQEAQESTSMSAGAGGLSIGKQKSFFAGSSARKSFSLSIGRDNQTGEIGVVKASMDSAWIKDPLRGYLESQGWKKAGFFANLFGRN